jgi:hypothetical protein
VAVAAEQVFDGLVGCAVVPCGAVLTPFGHVARTRRLGGGHGGVECYWHGPRWSGHLIAVEWCVPRSSLGLWFVVLPATEATAMP